MLRTLMSDPLVSVVIPTYNRLSLLGQAIESVREQTLENWELIVVDDGSTDGTAECLTTLCTAEPRLRLVCLPHTGIASRIRNEGVRHGRGRYVAFLDSDDMWEPNKLDIQLAALRAHPGARWSYTAARVIDTAGRELPGSLESARGVPLSGWVGRELLTRRASVLLSSILAEQSLLAEVGGFDERFRHAEDLDLALRLADIAECVGVPRPLLIVRVHPGQTTRTSAEPTPQDVVRVYEKYLAAHPSPEVRRECRRQQAYFLSTLAVQWVTRRRPAKAVAAAFRSLCLEPTGAELRRRFVAWIRRKLLRLRGRRPL